MRALRVLSDLQPWTDEDADVVRAAAAGPSVWLRNEALSAMEGHLDRHPGLRAAVLFAAGDPITAVRRKVERLLPELGPDGADLALEWIRRGEYDSDNLYRLVRAAASVHDFSEILAAARTKEVAGAIEFVLQVDGADPDSLAAAARRLEGCWDELLAGSTWGGSEDLFRIALAGGETEWVKGAALRDSSPGEGRTNALKALLDHSGSRTEGLDVAERIFTEARGTAGFRTEVVRILRWDDNCKESPRPRGILERAARDDPSLYVREAARLALEPDDE